jgi:hypothetical protein
VFQDAVAASARREVISPDGSINPRKLEGWLKRYQDTLRAIDERDGGAFSQGLRDMRTAQETLTAAQERQAAVREANEKGMLGQLIGSVDEADITRRVGTLFGGVDRVERARELRNMVAGNPAAEAGLRRSVIDHITEKFLGTVEIGEGQTGLRASMFQKFVRENQSVLRQLMSPEQVETLNAIALDLQATVSSAPRSRKFQYRAGPLQSGAAVGNAQRAERGGVALGDRQEAREAGEDDLRRRHRHDGEGPRQRL